MMARLSPRERRLVIAAIAVVALAGGWTLVWQPLAAARAAAHERIAEARTIHRALDLYPEGATPARPPAPDAPPATRVTRAAEAHGIALARIEPRGTGLTVFVDTAAFEDVIAWIARMETTQALRLTGVELGRRPALGAVSARLDLEAVR